MSQPKPTKNLTSLWLLLLIFIMPVLLSWWFLRFSDYIITGPKSNHGDLILPPHQVPEFNLINLQNLAKTRSLYNKWSLLYIITDRCAIECQQDLYRLNQIERALGKDSLRVQRVVLLIQPDSVTEIVSRYPGLWSLDLKSVERQSLLKNLRAAGGTSQATKIYIIDPLGNLIMSYRSGFNPYHIIADLKLLLKASKVG